MFIPPPHRQWENILLRPVESLLHSSGGPSMEMTRNFRNTNGGLRGVVEEIGDALLALSRAST